MSKTNAKEYLIIRDSQEKVGYWDFPKKDDCQGTVVESLETGDYTIKGYEDFFTIERKRNMSEFSQNLFQDRFYKELERMKLIEHSYLFLEFTWDEMISFPAKSGIPQYKWKGLKSTPPVLIKKYHELRIAYPYVKVEFVGNNAKVVASSLFKRIMELKNVKKA